MRFYPALARQQAVSWRPKPQPSPANSAKSRIRGLRKGRPPHPGRTTSAGPRLGPGFLGASPSSRHRFRQPQPLRHSRDTHNRACQGLTLPQGPCCFCLGCFGPFLWFSPWSPAVVVSVSVAGGKDGNREPGTRQRRAGRGAGNLGTPVAVNKGGNRSYECGVQSAQCTVQNAEYATIRAAQRDGGTKAPRDEGPAKGGQAEGQGNCQNGRRRPGIGIRESETRPGRRLDWASGQAGKGEKPGI